MSQLNDQKRFFIISLKKDKADWGPKIMRREFPVFFQCITDEQISTCLRNVCQMRIENRKPGSSGPSVGTDKENKVLELLKSDKRAGRKHLSTPLFLNVVHVDHKWSTENL